MLGKPPLNPHTLYADELLILEPLFGRACRGKDTCKHMDTYGGDDSSSKEKGTSEVPVAAVVGRVSYRAHPCVVGVKSVLQGKRESVRLSYEVYQDLLAQEPAVASRGQVLRTQAPSQTKFYG